jgi:hypothetical protein
MAQPTHRHKKRKTEYVLIGYGKMQAENWFVVDPGFAEPIRGDVDMREVAIYRSATDPKEIWVRPREEFEDGRFESLNSTPPHIVSHDDCLNLPAAMELECQFIVRAHLWNNRRVRDALVASGARVIDAGHVG